MESMLVVTLETLPGYEVRKVLGGVLGVAVRSRNPYREGVKTLTGITNPAMVTALAGWRQEAIDRLTRDAVARGGNAVVGMRFDHRDISTMWTEICAYGTAVVVVPFSVREAPAV